MLLNCIMVIINGYIVKTGFCYIPLKNSEFFSGQLTWLNSKLLSLCVRVCVGGGRVDSWNLYAVVLALPGLSEVCAMHINFTGQLEIGQGICRIYTSFLGFLPSYFSCSWLPQTLSSDSLTSKTWLLFKLPLGTSPQWKAIKNGNLTQGCYLSATCTPLFCLLLVVVQYLYFWKIYFIQSFQLLSVGVVVWYVLFAIIGNELCIFLKSEIPILCEVLIYLNLKHVLYSRYKDSDEGIVKCNLIQSPSYRDTKE